MKESGRAGRDGKPSDCILFYRFADIFRLSTMVFSQQTGLSNLYSIVDYCLDTKRCRRSVIASHFDETWEPDHCRAMCDHCRSQRESKDVDITKYCKQLYQILQNAAKGDVRLTGQMLIDVWLGKGKANLRVNDVPVPQFSRENCEAVVAHLLIQGFFQEDFHFTPYSTISYIKKGPRSATVWADSCCIKMSVSGRKILPTVPVKSLASSNSTVSSEEIVKKQLDSKVLPHKSSTNGGIEKHSVKDDKEQHKSGQKQNIVAADFSAKKRKSANDDQPSKKQKTENKLETSIPKSAVTVTIRSSDSEEELFSKATSKLPHKTKKYIISDSSSEEVESS